MATMFMVPGILVGSEDVQTEHAVIVRFEQYHSVQSLLLNKVTNKAHHLFRCVSTNGTKRYDFGFAKVMPRDPELIGLKVTGDGNLFFCANERNPADSDWKAFCTTKIPPGCYQFGVQLMPEFDRPTATIVLGDL